MLDVARHFLLVEVTPDGVVDRREVWIDDTDFLSKTSAIAGLGAGVLICGAVSWPFEAMLSSAGLQVIPNTCGPLDDVIGAFAAGRLTERTFLMPGCARQRHQHDCGHGSGW